jgi:hypothetical protein
MRHIIVLPIHSGDPSGSHRLSPRAAKPPIDYLTGYEAYSRRGQFKGWTEEERDQKLFKLIKLIHQCAPLSVTLAINGRAFDSLLRATEGS